VAGSDGGMQRQAHSTVRLNVSHSNLKAKFIEVRLDLHVRFPTTSFTKPQPPENEGSMILRNTGYDPTQQRHKHCPDSPNPQGRLLLAVGSISTVIYQ